MMVPEKRAGFTLVELLVVVAIIGILVGLLLPAVQAARESARLSACTNNTKQLGLACLNFESARRRLPAAGDRVASSTNNPLDGYSWIVMVLPYIEQDSMYTAISSATSGFDTNISSAIDTIATNVSLPQLICPSYNGKKFSGSTALTNYKAAAGIGWNAYSRPFSGDGTGTSGKGGVLTIPFGKEAGNSKTGITMAQISDGGSKTFMIAETKDNTGTASWTKGVYCWLTARVGYSAFTSPTAWSGTLSLGSTSFTGYGGGVQGVTSDHTSGVLHGYADGHVGVVNREIDADVFACLYSRSGGEPIAEQP